MTRLQHMAICAALAAPLAWTATATHAADCSLTLNDATVDYGRALGSGVRETAADDKPIATATRLLSVVCDASTAIGVKLDGPAQTSNMLQMGNSAKYTLAVTQMLLDGKAVSLGKSADGSLAVATPMPATLRPGDVVTPFVANVPVSGRRLDISLRADVYRAGVAGLPQQTTATSENQFRLVTP